MVGSDEVQIVDAAVKEPPGFPFKLIRAYRSALAIQGNLVVLAEEASAGTA